MSLIDFVSAHGKYAVQIFDLSGNGNLPLVCKKFQEIWEKQFAEKISKEFKSVISPGDKETPSEVLKKLCNLFRRITTQEEKKALEHLSFSSKVLFFSKKHCLDILLYFISAAIKEQIYERDLIGEKLEDKHAKATELFKARFKNDVIRLQQGSIIEIPSEISLLRPKEIEFQQNFIKNIPYALFSIQTLEKLDLTSNRITTISSRIGQLKNLKFLSLTENLIEELPAGIGGLEKLETLFVSENKLKQLPPEIGGLINLITLDVKMNGIESLPAEIGLMKSLRVLNVKDNPMNSLPPEMHYLTLQLRELILPESIKYLPPSLEIFLKRSKIKPELYIYHPHEDVNLLLSLLESQNNYAKMPPKIKALVATDDSKEKIKSLKDEIIQLSNLHTTLFLENDPSKKLMLLKELQNFSSPTIPEYYIDSVVSKALLSIQGDLRKQIDAYTTLVLNLQDPFMQIKAPEKGLRRLHLRPRSQNALIIIENLLNSFPDKRQKIE